MIDLPENVPFEMQECNDKAIVRVDKNMSYEEFFVNFLLANRPCIIDSFFSNQWKSRQEWIDSKGRPDFKFLKENFGSAKVPVADCNKQYFNAQQKGEESLTTYLEYWEDYCLKGYPSDLPCRYMKDWHFTRDFPDYGAYEWPAIFASDWLNEYWSTKPNDDYRFIYMGPKGSWTPMHCDVLTSYSWSTNICGRKRWLLFPPGSENSVRLPRGGFPFDIALAPDPNLVIDIEQAAGETIFVPSGWHHQVWNLEDTISVNHNWINGCGLYKSWSGLLSGLNAVRKELADCEDMENWDEQCQIILTATSGSNLHDFVQFLTCIAQSRIKCLEGGKIIASSNWLLGKGHAKFDLRKLLEILPELSEELGEYAQPAELLILEVEEALKW